MPADKISLDNSKKDKLFYFVANVVIYRESDKRYLILKRSDKEKVHPNKYTFPGGKLEWKDLSIDKPTVVDGEVLDYENAVEQLLIRETKEEAGIDIRADFIYLNSIAFIRPDGIPVIMIKLAAKYKSGEVRLEEEAFSDHKWVNEQEIKDYDCIQGMKEEIEKTINLFSK